jgi:hypothetical protein
MSEERQLYRIKRGSFTRRDGAEREITNHRGEKTGTYKEHVLYSPQTINEVMLTDREADAFGRNKLDRLIRGDNKTDSSAKKLVVNPKPKDEEEEEADNEVDSKLAAKLLRDGEKAKSPKEKRDFRKAVADADIIDDVPEKHADIMDLLKEFA